MKHRFSFVFLVFPFLVFAQLQSPSEFLGYEIGTEFSRHADVVSYFEHVAANSKKVRYFDYGSTTVDRKSVV